MRGLHMSQKSQSSVGWPKPGAALALRLTAKCVASTQSPRFLARSRVEPALVSK